MRNPFLLFLTTLVACSISITSTYAQLAVGFSPVPSSGPYDGTLPTQLSGSVFIPSPSGSITFGLQTTPNQWQKQLRFDLGTAGGLAPGAVLSVVENLIWNGTGPSPFTDWHEQITTSGFTWLPGSNLSIGTDNYGGTRSNGDKDLNFDFAPQTGAFSFTVSKQLQYDPLGPFIDSSGGPLIINVVEWPTVPEPEQAALLSGCLIVFWAIGRRIYRARHA